MKKSYFLIAVVSLLLAACGQDNDYDLKNVNSGKPASMLISLLGDNGSTRATGAPSVTDEQTINNGIIFVFNGTVPNSTIDGRQTFTFTNGTIEPVKVDMTQGIRSIYVVANVPNFSDFDNISRITDLYNIVGKHPYTAINGTALPMSGFSINVDATSATQTSPLAVTIPLNFINARVHIDWETPTSGAFSGLVIDSVSILNVKQKSDYFSTDNTTPLTGNVTDYYRGIPDISSFTGSYLPPTSSINDYNANLLTLAANKGFDNNYFYLYENGTTAPTIVSLRATLNGTVKYYPIVINGTLNTTGGDNTFSVKRSNIYYVKANITGAGTTDPYAPIVPGCLEITVTTAAWNPVINIVQDFQ